MTAWCDALGRVNRYGLKSRKGDGPLDGHPPYSPRHRFVCCF